MTELETIQRAKTYIDKMANGVDPLTDRPVAETDTLNQVRISRCLFFVSDVLRRVLENGGVTPAPPVIQRVAPFRLEPEQAARFAYSSVPLRITEIVNRIDSLIDTDSMKKLRTSDITGWLVEIGLLENVRSADGHGSKRPTERGRQMGIGTELRNAGDRSYEAVVYDINAQHFIIDNLEAAVAANAGRLGMEGKPWSAEDERLLAEMLTNGELMTDIAEKLKRRTSSVRRRARSMGLIKEE